MAAPVWVQSQINTSVSPGATSTFSLTNTFTSGNTLTGQLFVEQGASGATVTSIKDNLGNTYTVLAQTPDAAGQYLVVLWAGVNIPGSPTSIIVTYSTAPTGLAIYCVADESSGAGSIQASAQFDNTTATTTPTSGNMTATASNLVLGYYTPESGATFSAGSGFTLRITGSNGLYSESGPFGAGTVAATFTAGTAGTGVVGGIALAPPPVFVEWGDEPRGRQARRVPWRSLIRPDDTSGFPFTVVATPSNWADIEQYVGPKRRLWRPRPQTEDLIIIPFAPIDWGDELRGRQARRVPWRSKILNPDEFLNNPFEFPAPPWVQDPDPLPRRRVAWRAHPQFDDLIIIPAAAPIVFVKWGDELCGRQFRHPWHPPTQPDDLIIIPPTAWVTGAGFGNQVAGTTQTLTLSAAVGIGNGACFSIQLGSNVTLNSVTDNSAGSNTWVVYNGGAGVPWSTFGVYIYQFAAANIQGNPTTVTLHLSASAAFDGGVYDEYRSIASINAAVGPTAVAATANPGVGITTTQSGCIIWANLWNALGVLGLPPSGFALRENNITSDGALSADLIVQNSAGSITPTWTESSGDWVLGNIALLPAPSTPTLWADIEQYVGPKRRRLWHPPTQPDVIDGFPFTTVPVVFVEWGDELRGRQIRRIWHPLAQPDGLIIIPTAPVVFVEWGDELRGRQRRRVLWRSTILNPDEWFLPFFPPLPPPPPPTSISFSYEFQFGNLVSAYNTGQITVQQFYYALYKLQWAFSGATDWSTSFRPRAAPGDLPPQPIVPFAPTQMITNQADTVVDAATLVNTARALRALGCPPKAFPAPYPPRWAFQFYGGR